MFVKSNARKNVRWSDSVLAEGDLSTFALRKDHFACKTDLTSDLFIADSRPKCLRELYEVAGRISPGPGGSSSGPAGRRSPPLLCTPVLGARQRKLREKVDVEIETRKPAAIEELRKWTSTEALGDMTVVPGAVSRITANITLANEDLSDGGGFSSGEDEPIDHKLPSPEEQLYVIASKFCPEIVPIDTSGRRFDRMCTSRRSLLHVDTTCEQSQNADSQTVKRRTRSRKPRGKRRNTITGTDQKEIRDAIAGDASSPVDEPESPDSGAVIRSHSSDLLKKSPLDVQNKKSHFNSLRQWGRSRLRLMSRSPSDCRDTSKTDKVKTKSPTTVQDIDDVNIYETVTMRKRRNANTKQQERKISHERNNSYSSSEKSIGLPISIPMSSAMSIAVKLREVSSAGRRRRTTQSNGGPAKEEPHSSSGNWSASSESGRTSIGSEITSTTAAPRSSTSAATSSNSLNVPHGPPSSIVSRRRFLNTSGSGSVTSEGTLTPDIIHDLHDDMETSSEFSCDTEGYYTSFHMDSGLKTLKEEEISLPITPLHTTSTFSNSSGNQTVSTAESEYELFGKGSTSTTTSSAGTVCTTLLAAGSDRSLVLGPTVPERKSSLSKLNKSRSSSGSSSINLERSCSNSTTGSNSDRTGTIKRNTLAKANKMNLPLNIDAMSLLAPPKLENHVRELQNPTQETVIAVVHEIQTPNTGAESPDSGHNTSSSPIDDSVSSAHGGKLSCSEMDYSESSDLEGVDRIERIRVKTTINSSRIPSMCVITPNNSDDESIKSAKQEGNPCVSKAKTANDVTETKDLKAHISSRPKLELPPHETDLDTLVFNDEVKNYDNVFVDGKNNSTDNKSTANKATQPNNVKNKKSSSSRSYRSGLLPLNNLMCRLKEVFPQKLSMKKSQPKDIQITENVGNDNGEYVTIADVRNNNQKININNTSGMYYSNDVVKRNLQTVLSGKLRETEYVSLNELPSNISTENVDATSNAPTPEINDSLKRYGARVTLDAAGKVIYSSDSLKRRKGAHTTFEPGPFVKDIVEANTDECDSTDSSKTLVAPENLSRIATYSPSPIHKQSPTSIASNMRPLSPQLGKVIIRAPNVNSKVNTPTSEVVRMPPSNIVTPTNVVRPMSPRTMTKGAYVNIQDAEGISLSPSKDNNPDYRHSADQPLKANLGSPAPASVPPTFNMQLKSLQPQNNSLTNYNTINTNMPTATSGSVQYNKPAYWTLQQGRSKNIINDRMCNSPTHSLTEKLHAESHNDISKHIFNHSPMNSSPEVMNRPTNIKVPNFNRNSLEQSRQQIEAIPNLNGKTYDYVFNSTPKSTTNGSDSFKVSPIDPRNVVGFQASTPTSINNGNIGINSNSVTSPVRSTMSNEELYAVIHKSKKKLNIKSPPLDRASSPALSSTSLSPGSSESSIPGRVTPNRLPETGYLTDARNRHSWSPNVQDQLSPLERRAFEIRQDNAPRQNWTCSDRLGPPPQTSRLDFKKLLLQHGVKLNFQGMYKPSGKISAVERLRLSKEAGGAAPNQNMSNINILDLSGSPKTYTHRRVIRNNVLSPSSPSRTNLLLKENKSTPKILLSPKTQWRFSSPRSDVLSSPIPEVFNEDESPNGSAEKDREHLINEFSSFQNNSKPVIMQKQGANVKRNLIPVIKESLSSDGDKIENGITPLNNNSLRKNEDNNCTNTHCNNTVEKQYVASDSPGKLSRAEYIQAQKAQFLSQNSPISSLPPVNSFSVIFNSQLRHPSPPKNLNPKEGNKCPSPPTLETAL
ncbi:NHS actin remodeling regulator GUK-holder isoform X2 [Arctopsyche grandis]|uniref:NHS actin remodeling regulator GUK-holder isoform X2 n=1 Tax=Arctopsyche grandis TaxID=121162 RepID=UPI00406D84B0